MKKIFDMMTNDLLETFSDNLISVSIYGSAAGNNFIAGKSNINILAVVKRDEFEHLRKMLQYVKKWKKFKIAVPLVLTEDELKSSLDVFPMEFLDMKDNHRTIYGKDPFEKTKIGIKNLRQECEHELKGKLINLREGFLEIANNDKARLNLLVSSLSTFMAIFRNLLRLKNKPVPKTNDQVIETVSEVFSIKEDVFGHIMKLKKGEIKLKKKQLDEIFKSYIFEISKLANIVDRM